MPTNNHAPALQSALQNPHRKVTPSQIPSSVMSHHPLLPKPPPKSPIVLNASTHRPITAYPPPPTFLQTHVTTLQNNTIRLVTNHTAGGSHAPANKLRLKPGQKLEWLFKAKTSCMHAQRDIQKKVFEMTTRQSKIDTIDDLATIHNDFQTFLSKLTAEIAQIGATMKLDFIAGLQTVTLINRPVPGAGNAARKTSSQAKVTNAVPTGGLKIRPTSELLASTALPQLDPKPVEIDDDDDCTVVEDCSDPISLPEPEVCLSEGDTREIDAMASLLEPEVNISEGDTMEEAGNSVKGHGIDEESGSSKSKLNKTDEKSEETELLDEEIAGKFGTNPDYSAIEEHRSASANISNLDSSCDAEDDESGDPETRIMIRRALKESALETLTLENRKIAHGSMSEKTFEHFLSTRVYMESDYGTGLPFRAVFPRPKVKPEPEFDIEEMLTGSVVARATDKASFGDAFSQFLCTSGADEKGEDEADMGEENEDRTEVNDKRSEGVTKEVEEKESETMEQRDDEQEEDLEGFPGFQREELQSLNDVLGKNVQNGLCAMKSSCDNQDSGIDVDHSDGKMADNVAKNLSDVPLDELLFDMQKLPNDHVDFIGFDDKLLN